MTEAGPEDIYRQFCKNHPKHAKFVTELWPRYRHAKHMLWTEQWDLQKAKQDMRQEVADAMARAGLDFVQDIAPLAKVAYNDHPMMLVITFWSAAQPDSVDADWSTVMDVVESSLHELLSYGHHECSQDHVPSTSQQAAVADAPFGISEADADESRMPVDPDPRS